MESRPQNTGGTLPTVFCPAGLDGMPGVTGFEWNILSEYFHNFEFHDYLKYMKLEGDYTF